MRAVAGPLAGLLAEIVPAGAGGEQTLTDEVLGFLVGVGVVAGAARAAGAVEVLPQQIARGTGGLDGGVQGGAVIRHGSALAGKVSALLYG